MLQEIRAEARPILAKTKQAALDIPADAPHGTLRKQIARATKLQVRQSGVRIRVDQKSMGDREKLPRNFENKWGWTHPVFGRTNVKVRQPGHPWFYPTIQANTDELRRKVVRVLDKIADELERSV